MAASSMSSKPQMPMSSGFRMPRRWHSVPHTVRAALTRLRQQGYRIERVREDGVSRYRIAEDRKAA